MNVCTGGFRRAPKAYFNSRGRVLGVTSGQYALMRIPNDGGFSFDAKGFQCNSVHGSRIRIFYGLLCQGAGVRAYSARMKSRMRSRDKIRMHKSREINAK